MVGSPGSPSRSIQGTLAAVSHPASDELDMNAGELGIWAVFLAWEFVGFW